ncbi:MAG: hypothetical protein II855_09295 [Candidatus Methanomethylophilaceae archaeon]|nr:hypothetical protein [Candidatus Methanomethylophilaceae archaeon]
MVSIYEDSKNRYLKEGFDEGFDEGFNAGAKNKHDEMISHLADLVLSVAENQSITIDEALALTDPQMQPQIRAEIEKRSGHTERSL